MKKIRVGLHGANGHHVISNLIDNPRAELVALSSWDAEIPAGMSPKRCASLGDLLKEPEVDLVSLCSPRRREQAQDAVACLKAGKHVYAEKPCAMTEDDLDAIMLSAKSSGRIFHEMAGTAFSQPFLSMRKIVAQGTIGKVVQVFVQKSYPLGNGRPLDEDVDGGLLLQVGIHATRMVEHVAGTGILNATAVQTRLGNPRGGNLHVAASISMSLENGGVASIICNYLNPRGFPGHGNETLRIFGTDGMIEAVDGGTRTRLILADRDMGAFSTDEPSMEYFELFLDELQGVRPMPLTIEEELHPLRVLIQARSPLLYFRQFGNEPHPADA